MAKLPIQLTKRINEPTDFTVPAEKSYLNQLVRILRNNFDALENLIEAKTDVFVSQPETAVPGSEITIAHDFGTYPSGMFVLLKCLTAEHDIVVDELVTCTGIQLKASPTEVKVVFAAGGVKVLDSSGVEQTITPANFDVIIKLTN